MPARKMRLALLFMVSALIFGKALPPDAAYGKDAGGGPRAPKVNPHFRPHLGTSSYLFELNGVNIGTGRLSLKRDGDVYRIAYEARTNGKFDHLYKARYRGEGIIESATLAPVRAELHQRVRSKTKDTAMYFESDGRIVTTETKAEKGEEPESEVRETRAGNHSLDPLSAVFLLQGTDWEPGMEKVIDVYTGKARYQMRFTCVDKAEVESAGRKRAAWVITEVSRKLDEKQEEKKENQNPGLRIYVSAEGYPDVLKVETTRKIGHLTLTLVGFEPAPDQASR
jgi:hypothetical protein